MRPLISITFMLLVTLAGTASAQTQATAAVRATVAQDLQLNVTGETNFGSIGNFAHTETIDPGAPTASQETARLDLDGSGDVEVTCPTSVRLSGADGGEMIFTPVLAVRTGGGPQAEARQETCDAPISRALSTGSTDHFWLGGSVGVAENQAPGSYSGVFTLTVTYE